MHPLERTRDRQGLRIDEGVHIWSFVKAKPNGGTCSPIGERTVRTSYTKARAQCPSKCEEPPTCPP